MSQFTNPLFRFVRSLARWSGALRYKYFLGLCFALLLCWLGLLLPVGAGELAGMPTSDIPVVERSTWGFSSLDASAIPSEKVNQFVHACLQVVALIEQREGELQGAETESESHRIEQEIEAKAIQIIENAGLTRQEYLQLLSLANVDPEFGERIAALLQEAPG